MDGENTSVAAVRESSDALRERTATEGENSEFHWMMMKICHIKTRFEGGRFESRKTSRASGATSN